MKPGFFIGIIFTALLFVGYMGFRAVNPRSIIAANNTKVRGVQSISIDADVNDTTTTINYGNNLIRG